MNYEQGYSVGSVISPRQLDLRRSYLEHLEHQEHGKSLTPDDIMNLRISLGHAGDVNDFLATL